MDSAKNSLINSANIKALAVKLYVAPGVSRNHGCGNGKQLQAQKEEIINLTQKRLKRDFSLFLQRDSKETQKWLFELKKSLLSLFGGQKVTF